MGHFEVNEKDIFFILKNQLNYGSLCKLDRYQGLDEDTLDMLVGEAVKFAKGAVSPLQEIGEEWGVVFENNQVFCAPEFRDVLGNMVRMGGPQRREIHSMAAKGSLT